MTASRHDASGMKATRSALSHESTHNAAVSIFPVCCNDGCNRRADTYERFCESCKKRWARIRSLEPCHRLKTAPRNPNGTPYVQSLLRAIDLGADMEGVDAQERRVILAYRRSVRCG